MLLVKLYTISSMDAIEIEKFPIPNADFFVNGTKSAPHGYRCEPARSLFGTLAQ